ncbi:transcriptional regulator GcvA [Caballeronia sp. LZ062]|uniref:transcriptional regulator GcvA n=1 Tax=unclassified Caballeronia TaxID=2646786 RepID=UPI00285A0EBB|nr:MULTISPECIES: transcriptional regulator GcvA [unclassified Caballeronia]MDR5853433.1 transcriptional regulator GcvA [Caballeronia sp. LZ050]MDR5872033.1 transcriptional regulator GcvA [Caballeronia sp. LZ062]
MDLRQLPALNALRAFEAAARHESFSRAADELFVTHGAVSHQIRALEAELGVALFARDGKRVRLTDRGRQYAADVRAALVALAESTRRIRSGDRDRRLVVSMLSSFSARWLTSRVGGFIEKHPEFDLELLSTNALTDFSRDDVDVAIRFGYGKYSGVHAEPLLDEVFFPACSPRFNGGALPRAPADLANMPLLRSGDELWRPWFDAAGLPDMPEPKRGVLFEDSSNLLQAAIDGQGIALVRRSLAMREIIDGRLVRLFNVDGPSPWTYYFVCPPELLATKRVQAFREWIFSEAEKFRQLYERTPAVCDAPAASGNLRALP